RPSLVPVHERSRYGSRLRGSRGSSHRTTSAPATATRSACPQSLNVGLSVIWLRWRLLWLVAAPVALALIVADRVLHGERATVVQIEPSGAGCKDPHGFRLGVSLLEPRRPLPHAVANVRDRHPISFRGGRFGMPGATDRSSAGRLFLPERQCPNLPDQLRAQRPKT